MAAHANPATLQGPQPVPREAGQVSIISSKFDFAVASYRPASIAADDTILIGIVPAGCKLIPHLSRIAIPALDSGGSPTGDYSVGTAASAANLAASGASETARTLTVANILNASIGSRETATPIYATIINPSQTVPTTGAIVADLAVRPYDTTIDG
jgi:hypothetical protein